MVWRYPCQAAILSIIGIVVAKGMIMQEEPGLAGFGRMLAISAGLAACLLAIFWVYAEPVKRGKLLRASVLSAAFLAGLCRMQSVSAAMEDSLAGILDGQEASIQGRIINKQASNQQSNQISSRPLSGQKSDQISSWPLSGQKSNAKQDMWKLSLSDSYIKVSGKIRRCGKISVYVNLSGVEPVIGNTVNAIGKIKLFREARNDGNFDERAYNQGLGYCFTFYAQENSYEVVAASENQVREFLYRIRQSFLEVFQNAMPKQEAGVLCAMLLGEKSLLGYGTKELYRQGGISHILAISGLHISILGAAAFLLLRKIGACYAAASSVSAGILAMFAVMSGTGASAIRAVIMFGIYLGSQCCGRAYDTVNGLAIAAACIFLHNPRALFSAGAQFSFMAVAGVLLGKELCRLCRPRLRLAETVCISFGIQAMTLPLTAWYYFEIPVYSVLLNLFVLPFVASVLVMGLLGGAVGLAVGGAAAGDAASGILLGGCTFLLRYFAKAGEMSVGLPGAVYISGRPNPWQMGIYYLAVAVYVWAAARLQAKGQKQACVQPEKQHGIDKGQKWLPAAACVSCLGILFVRLPRKPQVTMLDVGQGDAIYIRTGNGIDAFIDGGSNDVSEAGTYRILPFLKSQGIACIDYWFVSHLDKDHISGLREIMEGGYEIQTVVLAEGVYKDGAYDKLMGELAQFQVGVLFLGAGDTLNDGKSCFRCLAPDAAEPMDGRNESSLVLLYEQTGFSAFFPGDISSNEEEKLLKGNALGPVTFYKAAHHGSRLSNSQGLLKLLKPAVSAVSCAEENSYGHPGKEAIRNMEKYSDIVFYTKDCGQVRITQHGDGYWVSTYL